MNDIVNYKVEDINRALDMLNSLNVIGLNNMAIIIECSQILRNPVAVSDFNNEKASCEENAIAEINT